MNNPINVQRKGEMTGFVQKRREVMNKEWEWQLIGEFTHRMRVPGGWVIRSVIAAQRNAAVSVHQVFIPDPQEIKEAP
jgi:hypothetical protein